MTKQQLKDLVQYITMNEVTKIEMIAPNVFKVYVDGSVSAQDRFNVSNQIPITMSVVLEEDRQPQQ